MASDLVSEARLDRREALDQLRHRGLGRVFAGLVLAAVIAARSGDNQTLHWTGATTVLVIRSLVVGPGQ
jgi:hypothetical protein